MLERIEPPPRLTQRARAVARDLIRRIRKQAAGRGLAVQPTLVGSLAKDTHLARPLDVDVFILFPRDTPREALETQGIALGRAVLKKPVLRYAEHPYVHGRADGFSVDVVPAYRLRSPVGRISAVDRTPFHTRYVKAHARARQRREIRLLKSFLRGTHCYGAETSTGGFSGYLAELLVLRYGAFVGVLEAAAAWNAPVHLSMDGSDQPMGGPLVFIDPVDATRNAAAAVSPTTFERFQRAARAFLQGPRIEFFFPAQPKTLQRAQLADLLERQPSVGVLVPSPPGRPETRLPQAHRLLAKVRRFLEEEGFSVPHADAFALEGGRLLLLLEHRPSSLPVTYDHRGPPASDAANAARFLEKWARHPDRVGRPRLERGRHVVTVRRRRTTPAQLVRPRLDGLMDGFAYAPARRRMARIVAGRALAASPALRLPLSLFLRRSDPWDP